MSQSSGVIDRALGRMRVIQRPESEALERVGGLAARGLKIHRTLKTRQCISVILYLCAEGYKCHLTTFPTGFAHGVSIL